MEKFNMMLPEHMLESLRLEATRQDMNVSELVRRFIKIGLLVACSSRDENAFFIVRKGNSEREIIIM